MWLYFKALIVGIVAWAPLLITFKAITDYTTLDWQFWAFNFAAVFYGILFKKFDKLFFNAHKKYGNENMMNREFADINKYREELVGQTIESVEFASEADEGLVIVFKSKASLCFRFSGLDGDIFIIPDSVTLAKGLRESLNK